MITFHDRLLLSLVRVAEKLKREQGAIFKKYGLTFTQYNVLCSLYSCKNGQATTSGVSNQLLISGPNISSLLKKLEREKLIIRKRDPNDERVILLKILPKGREKIHEIENDKHENLDKIFGDIEHEDQLAIWEICKHMLNKE